MSQLHEFHVRNVIYITSVHIAPDIVFCDKFIQGHITLFVTIGSTHGRRVHPKAELAYKYITSITCKIRECLIHSENNPEQL